MEIMNQAQLIRRTVQVPENFGIESSWVDMVFFNAEDQPQMLLKFDLDGDLGFVIESLEKLYFALANCLAIRIGTGTIWNVGVISLLTMPRMDACTGAYRTRIFVLVSTIIASRFFGAETPLTTS
jgi:hypothetical protein